MQWEACLPTTCTYNPFFFRSDRALFWDYVCRLIMFQLLCTYDIVALVVLMPLSLVNMVLLAVGYLQVQIIF